MPGAVPSPSRFAAVPLIVLPGLLAAMVVVVLLIGQAGGTDPVRPVLVVLPFEHIEEPGGETWLGDGLTEELIAQFGRRYGTSLLVVARTTAMRYLGTTKSIREIAGELQADYLLEGSVRREDGRVRITAQLIRGDDESHVWATNYQRGSGNALELQTEVGDRIADALGLKLVADGG